MRRWLFCVGLICLTIGSFFFTNYIYEQKNQEVYFKEDQENIQLYLESFNNNIEQKSDNKEDIEKTGKNDSYENISAIIEFPKLNLKYGLYDMESKRNSVNYGLEIISPSKMPDINSQLIIAGHSGTGRLAYFNVLNKLEYGDQVNIYYQGIIYSYYLIKKDVQEKNGELKIIDKSEYPLVLITCTENSNKTQDVYYFK